jgi:cytochrome c-type biogenesis protein CcmE
MGTYVYMLEYGMKNYQPASQQPDTPHRSGKIKGKFVIGGLIILAAVIYLIVSSTRANAQYFLTVEELQSRGRETAGQALRVSGVVLGDTIQYDTQNITIKFTVANSPGDQKEIDALGGMAAVLRAAAYDSSLPRLQVMYAGVKPDLLKNESQAIMTGTLGEDGIFYADELLLKCPTKYEGALPEQAVK